MPGLTDTPGRFGKYPVIPKEDGSGFNIILNNNPLTEETLTAPAVAPAEALPPDMTSGPSLKEDRATREPGGPGGGWVDDIMQSVGTGDSRAQYTPPAMPPDMGGNGLLSKLMPGGMGDTLSAVAGGMNTIERTQTPLAGFAAGFSGAMSARDTRRKDKRAEMLQDEERQWRKEDREYQRSRDVEEDKRYARRETRLDKAADLTEMGALVGLEKEHLALQKYKDDQRADKFGMSATERTQADADAKATLDVIIGKDNESYVVSEDDTPEEKQAKIDAFIKLSDQVHDQEYAKYQKGAPGVQEALQTPNAPAQSPSQVDPSKPGTSAASAISWTPGSEPQNEGEYVAQLEAAVAANGGNPIYVKNPRTGVVGLYVSRR